MIRKQSPNRAICSGDRWRAGFQNDNLPRSKRRKSKPKKLSPDGTLYGQKIAKIKTEKLVRALKDERLDPVEIKRIHGELDRRERDNRKTFRFKSGFHAGKTLKEISCGMLAWMASKSFPKPVLAEAREEFFR
jgi:hypothetical protein